MFDLGGTTGRELFLWGCAWMKRKLTPTWHGERFIQARRRLWVVCSGLGKHHHLADRRDATLKRFLMTYQIVPV